MKKYTAEAWNALTEEEKKNEIKDAVANMNPIILPFEGVNQDENSRLMSELKAYCAIQYYF